MATCFIGLYSASRRVSPVYGSLAFAYRILDDRSAAKDIVHEAVDKVKGIPNPVKTA